ncbi:extensin [Streptomyces sp. NPDC086554]|uniref:extensin n=1 Tax=Streptomyces sp. NPDC086554 TaxID=3154864 RepID=UPI003435F4D6
MKPIAAREAIALLTFMTRVLSAVGILALAFTTVNVTRFATSRDVPWPIALLLDPMLATALAGVLYVDARLAAWGIRPPGWSTALRWGAGCTAALMNSWESLWPDGQIGLPRQADPAAVLLHLTPALLLIALTETIAAYRRTVTDLLDRIDSADPIEPTTPPTIPPPRSIRERSELSSSRPHPPNNPPQGRSDSRPAQAGGSAHSDAGRSGPHAGGNAPNSPPVAPGRPPADRGTTNADVWPRAIALNNAALAATGKSVSIWRLRTDLHIGPRRARQIHDQLLAHPPHPPPRTD